MTTWLKTLGKRLAHFVFAIWLTITLLFLALVAIKGNPISLYLDPRLNQEALETIKQTYGYDKSPLTQYVNYLESLVTGDMGLSYIHKRPVWDVIKPRIRASLLLGLSAFSLGVVLAFLLLGMSVQTRLPWLARGSSLLITVCYSVPTFVIATLLLAVFAVELGWFPMFGSRTLFVQDPGLGDYVRSAVLPTVSLASHIGGTFALYLSDQMNQLDRATFILSARGRGVSEWGMFWNHKLRAVFPQFIQLLGLYLPTVGAGALVVEIIFGWAGMGTMLFDATFSRDYPLLLGGTLWVACLVIPGYELADYVRERFGGQEALR